MRTALWVIFGIVSTIVLTYMMVNWFGNAGYLAIIFFPCELFFLGAFGKAKDYTYSTATGLKEKKPE